MTNIIPGKLLVKVTQIEMIKYKAMLELDSETSEVGSKSQR